MYEKIIPEIGSTWQHRDGRILRVDDVCRDTARQDAAAYMSVLNPKPRQRRNPVILLTCFCNGDGTRALSPIK